MCQELDGSAGWSLMPIELEVGVRCKRTGSDRAPRGCAVLRLFLWGSHGGWMDHDPALGSVPRSLAPGYEEMCICCSPTANRHERSARLACERLHDVYEGWGDHRRVV